MTLTAARVTEVPAVTEAGLTVNVPMVGMVVTVSVVEETAELTPLASVATA